METKAIRTVPSFIQELLEHDIHVQLTKDSFVIEGFYKSGTVEVKSSYEGIWLANSRYDEVTPIDDLQDIVGLNYHWWQVSKDRYEGWSQPDSCWVNLLEQFEYITAEVVPAKVIYK